MDLDHIRRVLEDFFRLKRTYRSGWSYYGQGPGETIAAHTFGVAILTLLVGRELQKQGVALDLHKALVMALIHEVGETRLGDLHLEARRFLGTEAVRRAEEAAVQEVLEDEELVGLWREFEAGESTEAQFVRALDKLELLFEAVERAKSPRERVQTIFQTPSNRRYFERFPVIQILFETLQREIGDEEVSHENPEES